jgi:uncharacterized damage-inducible protein DinB
MGCRLACAMTSVLLELFRHKAWATLRLIEFCQTIDPSHLDASLPGTYGSVRATLAHLANAETSYFRRLTGEQLGPVLEEETATLDALAERIALLGPRWETLLDDMSLPDREIQTQRGVTHGVAPLAQAIHHADDHRTHVLSILGSRGLKVPELDIWAYAAHAGFSRATVEAPTA